MRVYDGKLCYQCFKLLRSIERSLDLKPAECIEGSWLCWTAEGPLWGENLKVENFSMRHSGMKSSENRS